MPPRPALALAALVVAVLPAGLPAQDLLVCGWNTSNIGTYDPGTGAFQGVWASSAGTGLAQAHSVHLGPDGNVYVSSFGNDQVLRFAPDGTFLGVFASTMDLGIDGPTDALFGPDGHLYVSGLNSGGVGRFHGTTGLALDQFVPPGQNNLNAAEMMEWGPDGNLYVCSASTDNVKVYAPSGAFVGNAFLSGLGGMNDPHDCVFHPNGNLLVAAFAANLVNEYDVSAGLPGTLVRTFVSSGGVGGPVSPHGLAWGPGGHLYVTSFSLGDVRFYDGSDGTPLGVFTTTAPTVAGATHLLFRPGAVDAPSRVAGAEGLRVYPNPARGRQSIAGALGRVTVFDAAGRVVARLGAEGTGAAGWDGRDTAGRPVPAGVYFLRAETPGGVEAVKIVRTR